MNVTKKKLAEVLTKAGRLVVLAVSLLTMDHFMNDGEMVQSMVELFNYNPAALAAEQEAQEAYAETLIPGFSELSDEELELYYEAGMREYNRLTWQAEEDGAAYETVEGFMVKQETGEGTFLLMRYLDGEMVEQAEYPCLTEEEYLEKLSEYQSILSIIHQRLTGISLAF